MTVTEALVNLVESYKLHNHKSLASLESRIKPIIRKLGDYDIEAITPGRLQEYAKFRLAEGRSRTTINREFAALKRALRLQKHDIKLAEVPHFPMFREDNVRTGILKVEQFQAILKFLPARYRALAQLGWLTGRRKGELLKIRIGDLGTDGINIPGSHTKNGKADFIPWTPEIHSAVCGHLKVHAGDELLFDKMSTFDVSWKKACIKAGYPGTLFHDIRRSVASDLIQAGVDLPTAMRVTGHKTMSMFLRYNIVSKDAIQAAQEKLTRYREGE